MSIFLSNGKVKQSRTDAPYISERPKLQIRAKKATIKNRIELF